MIRARLAFGIVLTVSGCWQPAPLRPKERRGGLPRPPYTPAAGAKDLRAVLFNWTSYILYEVRSRTQKISWSVGDDAANNAADPECRGWTANGARQLRSVRTGGYHLPDPAL